MIRRLALAALLALWPALASAQFATIAPTPAPSDNGDRIATTAWVNSFFAGGTPLASGKIFVGSAGGFATQQSMSGDCTLVASGVITCTQAAGNFNVIGILSVGGGELQTNIVAPSTPAAGKTQVYVDSTTKTLSAKNDAGTVSNTVVPSTAVANQFMTGISAAGVITRAQPAFTDLSGSGTCAQEPARIGDVTAPAGSCTNTAVKVNGVAYATSPSTDTVPVITAANTATYTALPNCVSGVLQYTAATHLFNCGAAPGASPYFSAHPSAASTTVTTATQTKMAINTKDSDSNTWFDAVTNFRYTPLSAGRYNVHVAAICTGTSVTSCIATIFKNGSTYSQSQTTGSTGVQTSQFSSIINMNGTTDFLEAFVTVSCTGTCAYAGGTGPIQTIFEASFISP